MSADHLNQHTDWTDERIATLKRLWLAGQSAGAIAAAMRSMDWIPTRSAIIGKVHRLGLADIDRTPSLRALSLPRAGKAPNTRALVADGFNATRRATPKAAQPVPAPPTPFRTTETERPSRTLLELGPGMCRWPIGDPLSPTFGFCGQSTRFVEGERHIYCAAHFARAYIVPPPRKTTLIANPIRSTRRHAA